jgi:type VI secretion system Hcp family effector
MIRRLSIALGALVCLLVLAGAPSLAAYSSYLDLEAQNLGEIHGEVETHPFENTIEVFDFHHLLLSPEGMGTTHEEIIFTIRLGKASPLIAFVMDNNIQVWGDFKFVRVVGGGGLVNYYTVAFEGGRITAVEPITPNVLDPANGIFPDMVRVRLTYQSLTLTYMPEGIEVQLSNAGKGK